LTWISDVGGGFGGGGLTWISDVGGGCGGGGLMCGSDGGGGSGAQPVIAAMVITKGAERRDLREVRIDGP
jgi:hypothetical protein